MTSPTSPGVSWLVQTAADLARDEDWLSTREQAVAHGLLVEKRRSEWLLGRWTAKRALALQLGRSAGPNPEIEILADPDGAPSAYEGGASLRVTVSLSHRDDVAACVLAEEGISLGCDLERIEPRSERFVRDFFTEREYQEVGGLEGEPRDLRVALTWSAKESVLKALRTGLRRDTRSVELTSAEEREGEVWHPLRARDASAPEVAFAGWWCRCGPHVLTVMGAPPLARPMALLL